MTPEDLALVERDGNAVKHNREAFSAVFYTALFEIDPETRSLFPIDLVEQRGKLVAELEFLVEAATSGSEFEKFLDRARELGRRHVDYGVSGGNYRSLGAALQSALREFVPDWDEDHEQAWTKLYRLISDVMREGAEAGLFAAD